MGDAADPHLLVAENTLDTEYPGYLALVRDQASQLGVRQHDSTDLTASLTAVVEFADVDVDVPTASLKRGGRWGKLLLKRLIRWYLQYLGHQVTALGHAVANLGTNLVDLTADLEARTAHMETKIGTIEARLDRLEGHGREPH